MSTKRQKEKMKLLSNIRELCSVIIYQTHGYLNDSNSKRLTLIENQLEFIQSSIDKLKV